MADTGARLCGEVDCGESGTVKFGRAYYCEPHATARAAAGGRRKAQKRIGDQLAKTGVGPHEERALRLVTIAHDLDERLAHRSETEFAVAELEDLYRRSLLALCRAEGVAS